MGVPEETSSSPWPWPCVGTGSEETLFWVGGGFVCVQQGWKANSEELLLLPETNPGVALATAEPAECCVDKPAPPHSPLPS